MAFTPISNEFIQHTADASGTSAAGYFLKLYAAGTTTPISAALDSDGSTLVAKVELDSLGYVQNASGGSTTIYIDQEYRLVLYVNATDADANTFANAVQDTDNIPQLTTTGLAGGSVSNVTALKALTGQADNELINIVHHTTDADGGGGVFWFDSSSSAADNNGTILQPDSGSGRWIRQDEGALNVKWFGAIGDGVTDDTTAIQAAIDTGDHVHLENPNGEKYLISSTLTVLGEDGLGRVREGFRMTADVGSRDDKQVLQVAAGSGIEAVIQILDGISANPIITLCSFENISIDGNGEAVFGLACGKWASSINQLVKMFHTENLSIKDCRFGYMIGGAASVETDSAGYSNTNTVIEDCDDGAVLIDTGNGAAISFTGHTFNGNGFNPTTEATYNPSGDGFNIKVVGGEVNLVAGTSAGLGATQPDTADIIASSADVRINGHWSDTHGLFLKESGGADSSIYINGLRHNEGGMTDDIDSISATNPMVVQANNHSFQVGMNITLQDVLGMVEVNGNTYAATAVSTNTITFGAVDASSFTAYTSGGLATTTPVSIEHQAKITYEGVLLHGVIESNEGVGGSVTTLGVNFVSGGPAKSNATAYTGTLKTNQKGVCSINNFGNRAQIAIGGGARDMAHLGAFTPQWLGLGPGSSATGPTCISQVLGPATTDTGYTEYLDEATGTKTVYVNCYKDDTAGLIAPILIAKDCHIIDIGGGSFNAFTIRRHKFANTTPVAQSTFVEMFQIRQGVTDGTLSEVAIAFPHNSGNPTAVGGDADYWEGTMYYHTGIDKLVVNTSGTTWETITSA